jgi:hypothetical protein
MIIVEGKTHLSIYIKAVDGLTREISLSYFVRMLSMSCGTLASFTSVR